MDGRVVEWRRAAPKGEFRADFSATSDNAALSEVARCPPGARQGDPKEEVSPEPLPAGRSRERMLP